MSASWRKQLQEGWWALGLAAVMAATVGGLTCMLNRAGTVTSAAA